MDKLLKVSLVASIAVCSLNASSELVNQQIESLQSQINELKASQDRIKKLENQIKKLKASQDNMADDLEDRIDEVETSTMTDKIKFGVEFRSRMDNFKSKNAKGESYSNNNVWSNRLRLNMYSKITDDMKFRGRLTMYKNWADNGNYDNSNQDSMQGRRPSNSSLYVTRAFVDWRLLDGKVPVTLTIGRQPSSDGPSHQFKDNSVRKSTYSALSFDGTTDGIVSTINLQKVSKIDGMALRFAYGKGYQANTGSNYVGDPNAINDATVMGEFFETGLGMDGSLMQLGAVQVADVVSNVPNDNKNIGDINLYTAMLELSNFKSTGVDLFAHYAISQSKPNGKTSTYNGQEVGLLTSTTGDTATKTGSAFWIGARYTIPMKSMKNPKIGAEYNHGSKNWFSFTQGSNDITNKLATRGDAVELYYIQPINRYSYIRLGWQFIDYEYTGSGYQIGAPTKISETRDQNALDSLSDLYLLFNVAF